MMELSTRLQAVADFVTAGYKLADIGTDHAYIPIALVDAVWRLEHNGVSL